MNEEMIKFGLRISSAVIPKTNKSPSTVLRTGSSTQDCNFLHFLHRSPQSKIPFTKALYILQICALYPLVGNLVGTLDVCRSICITTTSDPQLGHSPLLTVYICIFVIHICTFFVIHFCIKQYLSALFFLSSKLPKSPS